MNAPIRSVVETSAADPVARHDPHPRLKSLREHHPVFRDELAKTWFLTRYADVRAVLNDRTLKRWPGLIEEGGFGRILIQQVPGQNRTFQENETILLIDDPDHARVRSPLAKALYARVAKSRPKVDAIVADVLGAVQGRSGFDVIADVAIPIPIITIARILGVDEQRLADFRKWSEDAVLSINPRRSPEQTRDMVDGANALDNYFRGLMAERRSRPADDLVTDLVTLQAEGAPISDDEISINLFALLIGGNLTTTDLIGNGVRLFLLNPGQKAKLTADQALVPQAVEEILRYDCPVDMTARVLMEDRTIGGCPMKAHQETMVSLRAANRDPEAFERPDEFDITRKGTPHVSFGGGAHICIGAPLARMEAASFFSTFFQRFPTLKLVDEKPQWRALPFFRGLERLMVEV